MKSTRFSRPLAAAALGLALVSLGACATASRPAQMTIAQGSVAPVQPGDPAYHAIRVARVEGGSRTNPLWISNISNEDFKTALENSLDALGYLATDASKATIELVANLTKLNQPFAGLDMTVTSTVQYTAKAVDGQKLVFEDKVAAAGTAKFGDALIGAERLRKANEASIRENIVEFTRRFREGVAKPGTVAAR
jgi:hypothetical protein